MNLKMYGKRERVMHFSRYLLFDGMGDALMFLPNVPGTTFIPGAMSIPVRSTYIRKVPRRRVS